MDWLPVAGVVVLAMAFAYTNGFHDSSNAVATSVSTRALTPRAALMMAAAANFIGAFFGTRVAETVVSGLIEPPTGDLGLQLITAALVGAIGWNLLTWWRGLPSSSTHALVGGLVGAVLVAGTGVQWGGLLMHVLVPMLLSPLVGFFFARVCMRLIHRISKGVRRPGAVRRVRVAQSVSAAAMAFGHGMQDAAKTAGVIGLALIAGGVSEVGADVPWWALALAATAIALGTYSGGWRIMRTLGRRIADLEPAHGLAAEASAAAILYWATLAHAPISTTYTITGSITGAGSTRGTRAVRWSVVGAILVAWLTTLPGAALAAAALMALVRLTA